MDHYKKKTRVAVIGVGSMGYNHARAYERLENVELVGVYDTDTERANRVAGLFGVEAFKNLNAAVGRVDAVSIVTPTDDHVISGNFFMNAGIDVLIEKPLAPTAVGAALLISASRLNKRILQVGHIERFNGAVEKLLSMPPEPILVLWANRVVPFSGRAGDVSVVMDLMIHDIDIMLKLARSKIVLDSITAYGFPVVTDHIDLADVSFKFENGCVGVLHAGRAFQENQQRTLDILYQDKTHAFIDYAKQWCIRGGLTVQQADDQLRKEISSFIDCVRNRKEPVVTGEDGLNALLVVEEIEKNICGES